MAPPIVPSMSVLVCLLVVGLAGRDGVQGAMPPLADQRYVGRALSLSSSPSAAEALPLFYSMWANGYCEKLEALMAPSFEYVVSAFQNPDPSAPPVSYSKALFLANWCPYAFVTNATFVQSFGEEFAVGEFIGADIDPSTVNGSAPCPAFFHARMTLTMAGGLITQLREILVVDEYIKFNQSCFPSNLARRPLRIMPTRGLPPVGSEVTLVPDDVHTPMQFARFWMDLFWKGACAQMGAYLSPHFTFVESLSTPTKPLDKAAFITFCSNPMRTTTPEDLFVASAIADGPYMTLAGPSMSVVHDPVRDAPCAVYFQQALTVKVTTVSARTFTVEQMTGTFDSDVYTLLANQCHWKP